MICPYCHRETFDFDAETLEAIDPNKLLTCVECRGQVIPRLIVFFNRGYNLGKQGTAATPGNVTQLPQAGSPEGSPKPCAHDWIVVNNVLGRVCTKCKELHLHYSGMRTASAC